MILSGSLSCTAIVLLVLVSSASAGRELKQIINNNNVVGSGSTPTAINNNNAPSGQDSGWWWQDPIFNTARWCTTGIVQQVVQYDAQQVNIQNNNAVNSLNAATINNNNVALNDGSSLYYPSYFCSASSGTKYFYTYKQQSWWFNDQGYWCEGSWANDKFYPKQSSPSTSINNNNVVNSGNGNTAINNNNVVGSGGGVSINNNNG